MATAQIKLNFSEQFKPLYPMKTISMDKAQKLLGVDENYLNFKVNDGELSISSDGNFYTEQILKLRFSNDEYALKNVQGSLFTPTGGIDTALAEIMAANQAQVTRIDSIKTDSEAWTYLLKAIRNYFSKGNVILQISLLDDSLREKLLKILPNENLINVDNEILAWCTKDKEVIENLIQTAEKTASTDNALDTGNVDSVDDSIAENVDTAQVTTIDVENVDSDSASTDNTLEVLTQEIKHYFVQMAQNIIEIGKRLIAAKEILPHGNWQNWLEENFSLTVRTAQYYMAVADRFGNSKTNTYSFLPLSNLKQLLALPTGDEEKFIAEMASKGTPIEKLSVRKLKTEIKEWKSRAITASSETVEDTAIDISAADSIVIDAEFSDAAIVDNSDCDEEKILNTNAAITTPSTSINDNEGEIIDAEIVDSDSVDETQDTTPLDNALDFGNADSAAESVQTLEKFNQLANSILTINSNAMIDYVNKLSNADFNQTIKTLELIIVRFKTNRN